MQKGEISEAPSDGSAGKTSGAPSADEIAATKIQAGVRGFLVRKRQKNEKENATKQ